MTPMSLLRTREAEIVAVGIRLGWRGQPVVQIQRQRMRPRFIAEDHMEFEPCGTSAWRDAGKADAIELANYLASIGRKD